MTNTPTTEEAIAAILEALKIPSPKVTPIKIEAAKPATLAEIIAEFSPYDQFPEFAEGYDDYCAGKRSQPYTGVKAQAYDRGAVAAHRFERLQRERLPNVS